jgi:uncharacterized protein YqeY
MDLKTHLETSLKEALRSGNDIQKQTIRMVLAAVKFTEIEKKKIVDESEIIIILQKEIKSRRESIQDAIRANRPDLIERGSSEILVLETFLPEQFTDDEIKVLAGKVIAEANAVGMADFGRVMKVLVPQLQGRAAVDRVSQILRQILQ